MEYGIVYLHHSQLAGPGRQMQRRLSVQVPLIDEVVVVVVVAVIVALRLVVVVSKRAPRLDRCVAAQLAGDLRAAVVVRAERGGVQRRAPVVVVNGPCRVVVEQHPGHVRVAGGGGQVERRLTAVVLLVDVGRFAGVLLAHGLHQLHGVLLDGALSCQVQARVLLPVILVNLPRHLCHCNHITT